MSGDAGTGVGTFNATNSKISIKKSSSYYKTAPMFFVTNTSAVINLTNTTLSYGSGTLLSVKGTSQWGTTNSNGGTVTINANKQTLTGNITADKLSTVTLNLTNGSTYKGAINTSNKAKKVTLKLDKSSKITLTGDTYVTFLSDADSTYSNINLNGHKLYVNGKLFTK
jgi:translation elongation factor P/translation initiation factor 5A